MMAPRRAPDSRAVPCSVERTPLHWVFRVGRGTLGGWLAFLECSARKQVCLPRAGVRWQLPSVLKLQLLLWKGVIPQVTRSVSSVSLVLLCVPGVPDASWLCSRPQPLLSDQLCFPQLGSSYFRDTALLWVGGL